MITMKLRWLWFAGVPGMMIVAWRVWSLLSPTDPPLAFTASVACIYMALGLVAMALDRRMT
jgi:uncharacterized membrane protein YdcZ (DUF606 family)